MLEISSTLKKRPGVDKKKLKEIKDFVLGKNYNLSLVFVGDKLSRSLNKKFRKKDKIADVLSFPLDYDNGEVFINPTLAERKALKYGYDKKDFIYFLFIHALSHLKGYDHQNEKDFQKMQNFEKKIGKKFGVEKTK